MKQGIKTIVKTAMKPICFTAGITTAFCMGSVAAILILKYCIKDIENCDISICHECDEDNKEEHIREQNSPEQEDNPEGGENNDCCE